MFADKVLKCSDCGLEFTFTAGEREFFASKGFVNDPKRCPACRTARRGQQRTGSASSGGSYGRSREMYSAVCAECGAEAMVPFQPRGDRPVYCSACYSRVREGSYR